MNRNKSAGESKRQAWQLTTLFSHFPFFNPLLILCRQDMYTHTQTHTPLLPTPLIRQMTGKDSLRCQIRLKGNYWLLQLHSVSSLYQRQHGRKNWSVAFEYYPKIAQTNMYVDACAEDVWLSHLQLYYSTREKVFVFLLLRFGELKTILHTAYFQYQSVFEIGTGKCCLGWSF